MWWDGEQVCVDAPSVPASDRSFLLGDGLFETVKVDERRAIALDRHLRRLASGAERIGLDPVDLPGIRAGIDALLGAVPAPRGRLRIAVSAGSGPLGPIRGDGAPRILIAWAELPAAAPSVALARVPWVRNERSPLVGIKSASYAENLMILAGARAAGADEAVLANTVGLLCEGATVNIGVVVDGIASTPTAASGCLPGVARELALERCDLVEQDHPIDVLGAASELFVMSATRGIQPVHRVDDRLLPAPGPVTSSLVSAWNAAEDAEGGA